MAYLAISGIPKSRYELATLFYPQNDQSAARTNFRRDLFELKSSLDDAVFSIESGQVSLNSSEQVWIDVNEFLNLVYSVRKHHKIEEGSRHESLCIECSKRLTQAIELFSADFLSGFSVTGSRQYEDWQFFQSETLRNMLSDSLQQIIRWHEIREEYDPAISYGRRWLALDPSHEPAHRNLMSLYAHSGQQAAALRQYAKCTRLLKMDQGVEPDAETTDLYEAIRANKFPENIHSEPLVTGQNQKRKLISAVNHNLPPPEETMTGRESELEWITNQLRNNPDCRMLTLLGPGGIGKTRLAIEAVYHLVEDSACPFCEGIYFVSLVSHPTSDSIVPAIADTLKLSILPNLDHRTEQLLGYLHPKRLLLLLDNFEHLVNPESIQLLSKLLEFAPQVKLLVTSRTRLNAHFEHILTLEGLGVPQYDKDYTGKNVEDLIAQFSAIQLFIQRARHLKPDISFTSGDLKPVVQICRIVEGMPLGIELAAAWLDILTPAEIIAEITRSLDFLAVQWPDRPERQHSLRAVFDSSWRLLAEPERAALMYMTLFQGSFSRDAAQAVSGASIQLLMSLHSKSWLQIQENGRFQIHELLCQYANHYLQAQHDTWQLAKRRFCSYYATFLDHQIEPVRGSRQREAFEAISIEFENICIAWQWLVEGNQVEQAVQQMLPALYRYAEVRAMAFELTRLVDFAIEAEAWETNLTLNPHLLSILRTARAAINNYGYSLGVNYFLLNPEQKKTIHEVWSVQGEPEPLKTMGYWGILLAYLYGLFFDEQIAVNRLQELISYYREQKQLWELAYALSSLGSLLVENTINYNNPINILVASQNLMQGLSIFQELGDKSESGSTMDRSAILYQLQSKYMEAIEQWQNAQVNLREGGEWASSAFIFMNLANVYSQLGEHESVFQNYQAASQALSELGLRIGTIHALSAESIYALRYSDIQHARRTRQESLSLYQEAGNASGTAWSNWEMGEIHRVAGDIPEAKEWFEKARVLFESLEDPTSSIFLLRGLGDIAQMRDDFDEAKKYFQESKLQSDQTNHSWGQVYALCGLGRAEVSSGELEAAREHFSQSIRIAQSLDKKDLELLSIAGYARIFASLGKFEQAVELCTMVIHNKFSWNETKAQMLTLKQSIQSLPTERFLAAQERGQNLDFEEAFKRIDLLTQ